MSWESKERRRSWSVHLLLFLVETWSAFESFILSAEKEGIPNIAVASILRWSPWFLFYFLLLLLQLLSLSPPQTNTLQHFYLRWWCTLFYVSLLFPHQLDTTLEIDTHVHQLLRFTTTNNNRRNYSLEKKSSDKERGSSTYTSTAGSGTAVTMTGKKDKKGIPTRKSSLNIFERLRQGKQDKIAANVQKKIRAVREAEDLDRRINAKRSE